MADFDEVRFPTNIAYGSSGGPEFSTQVVELGSGHEKRNQNWAYPRERWNVAYGVRQEEDLIALISFFYQRRGRARGFRFKNHADFTATDQVCQLISTPLKTYQIVKHYGTTFEFIRKITKLVGTVTVKRNGATQTQPGQCSVDLNTGVITFVSSPGSDTITASYTFDIPMRFDTDHLPTTLDTYLAQSANVTLVELKV